MAQSKMDHVLDKYGDLSVASNDLRDRDAFTLVSLVHNEMYYLPAFLAHYRSLGVARFIFIDDQSIDGSDTYLAAQADVMVMRSPHRFGDVIEGDDAKPFGKRKVKMNTIWRQQLLRLFAMDRWALCVDVDEFIDLPKGRSFPDIAAKADKEKAALVWAVMLDMYPQNVTDLARMAEDETLDLDATWYFDGQPHLKPMPPDAPSELYAGSRARLLQDYALNHRAKPLARHWARFRAKPPLHYNTLQKPSLVKWSATAVMNSPHVIHGLATSAMLLPMRHFRFTGETYRRISWALESGGYAGGSIEYRTLSALLGKMAKDKRSFCYDGSRLYQGFDDFAETGNALGLG
ncbi:glycosyltransferase family 2 protein [Yoonia sp. F2084L]|uniref:glycosyltransferase family 2 protein n=1 Tax=Yoonia sp. F2084L TaxID=2926419 RepID=UPI001FF6581F|nr:glycosyltransferase family 2 protein [Yoonia sp. F2084L]MCK0096327.1 glycosyltransferase family 2 protein [Yoonia sp. F2084L]